MSDESRSLFEEWALKNRVPKYDLGLDPAGKYQFSYIESMYQGYCARDVEIAELQAENDQLRHDIARHMTALTEALTEKERLQTALVAAGEAMVRSKNYGEIMRQEVERLGQCCDELELTNDELELMRSIADAGPRWAKISSKVVGFQAKVKNLKKTAKVVTPDQQEMRLLKMENDALKSALVDANGTIRDLTGRLEERDQRIAELEAKVERMRGENAALSAQAQAASNKIHGLIVMYDHLKYLQESVLAEVGPEPDSIKFVRSADAVECLNHYKQSAINAAAKSLANEVDAKRYRWLRLQDWFDGPLCVLRNPKVVLMRGSGLGADCPSRERLDSAIDAAIAQSQHQVVRDKYQPCGCVLCTCEDEVQCQGCGAKCCDHHKINPRPLGDSHGGV